MISLIFAGRVKEHYYTDAANEYIKRIGAYSPVTLMEIREERTPENASESQIDAALKKEADAILGKIPNGAFVCTLCVEGDLLSSEQLAKALSEAMLKSSKLCFIIGSSNGLHESVKRRANLRLSLSRMTLPHSLARVVTVEQLYRALNLTAGGKYHK